MTNNFRIPDLLEKKIRERDKQCVYCHSSMNAYPIKKDGKWSHNKFKTAATIEHFDDEIIYNPPEEKLAICCMSCNTSRGAKELKEWFNLPYCKKRGINKDTVANVVKKYLKINNYKK